MRDDEATLDRREIRGRDGEARRGRARLGELALEAVELAAQRLLARLALAHLQLGLLPPLRIGLAALLVFLAGLLRALFPATWNERLIRARDELFERRLDRRKRSTRTHQRRDALGSHRLAVAITIRFRFDSHAGLPLLDDRVVGASAL